MITLRKSLSFVFIVLFYTLLFPAHSFPASSSDNYSLQFDGGDRVIIPDSPSLNPSQITVETWVYLNRLAPVGSWDNQILVSKGNDGAQGSYSLSANRDQFHFYIRANGVDQVYAATPSLIKTGRWYHMALLTLESIKAVQTRTSLTQMEMGCQMGGRLKTALILTTRMMRFMIRIMMIFPISMSSRMTLIRSYRRSWL